MAILALTCCFCGFAQNNDTVISVFLSENTQYFEDAYLKDDGTLEIIAKKTFTDTEPGKKSSILELSLKKWDGEMIFIRSGYSERDIPGYKTEVWTKNRHTGIVSPIGNWDLNSADVSRFLPKELETTRKHPWFFYVGGQSSFNSDAYSLFLNTRVGAFLLKDWWDLGLSAYLSGNVIGENISDVFELGISSKIYWPIRKYKISPYIGTGVSWGYSLSIDDIGDVEATYTRTMFLIGTSWYIGPGSLDFGLQFGDNFNVTVGYTFLF
jgi:hypothetical protein